MCRLLLYLGKPIVLNKLLIEPTNSLINQSIHAQSAETPVNGDGFGVAWYVHDISMRPGRYRSLTPAWSNNNLVSLARVTRSATVLAHVRAASVGLASAENNCHPFTYSQYAFAHNGDVTAFARIRRDIEASLSDEAYALIEGNTDSEHVFAIFVDALRTIEHSGSVSDPLEIMGRALEAACAKILAFARVRNAEDHDTYLNLAVTDGVRGVACRCSTDSDENTPTLFVYRRGEYSCENGVCRLNINGGPRDTASAVVVSSERLTDDPAWEEIPLNHMVLIGDDHGVTLRAMDVVALGMAAAPDAR